MIAQVRLDTERLLLRELRDGDVPPLAALNADPRVMQHFPAPLSAAETEEMVGRIRAHVAARGFGMWAVEVRGGAPFIGLVGLAVPRFEAHFTPCVEVGWRLAAEHWGRGYATEAARAAVAFGFDRLGLAEIVSFTVPGDAALAWRRLPAPPDPRHEPARFARPLQAPARGRMNGARIVWAGGPLRHTIWASCPPRRCLCSPPWSA
jgi:RimJ/RimL family protein N-acetyltransferase